MDEMEWMEMDRGTVRGFNAVAKAELWDRWPLSEREEISRGIAAARSMRSMARLLGHSPSTVSREIERNGGYDRY